MIPNKKQFENDSAVAMLEAKLWQLKYYRVDGCTLTNKELADLAAVVIADLVKALEEAMFPNTEEKIA